jgi:hypothetical protein
MCVCVVLFFEAVESIEGLNRWKIKLVTIKDMTSALVVKMSTPNVKRGQWVRMKKGNNSVNDSFNKVPVVYSLLNIRFVFFETGTSK